MSSASASDKLLSSAISSGHRLELSFIEAGADVDIVEKNSKTSVYKLARDQANGTIELVGQQGGCQSTSLRWEGFGDEGGLAVASRRFLFTYDGQQYVWAKHRKFAGDNLSCENISTGNTVAYYTNKLLPKKLQGILIIEPQVQDMNLLHTLVAGCMSYREFLERRDMLVWGDSWFSQSISC